MYLTVRTGHIQRNSLSTLSKQNKPTHFECTEGTTKEQPTKWDRKSKVHYQKLKVCVGNVRILSEKSFQVLFYCILFYEAVMNPDHFNYFLHRALMGWSHVFIIGTVTEGFYTSRFEDTTHANWAHSWWGQWCLSSSPSFFTPSVWFLRNINSSCSLILFTPSIPLSLHHFLCCLVIKR